MTSLLSRTWQVTARGRGSALLYWRPQLSRTLSGWDKMVENQINSWKRKGGQDASSHHGKRLPGDRNRHVANALGVGDDYVHSKILADNNIKPESIQRRLDLDQAWQNVQKKIRNVYNNQQEESLSVAEFAVSSLAAEQFTRDMQDLNRKAKRVNDAIISDSLRFNGRSPVPHAKGFDLQERILEALEEGRQERKP